MGKGNTLFNQKRNKNIRLKLRNTPTPAELRLWQFLKNKQFRGLKFRRQHSIEKYVVDFYCPSLHLAIEIDGDTHDEKYFIYDTKRQQFIETLGITVIRFSNQNVFNNIEDILEAIASYIPKTNLP